MGRGEAGRQGGDRRLDYLCHCVSGLLGARQKLTCRKRAQRLRVWIIRPGGCAQLVACALNQLSKSLGMGHSRLWGKIWCKDVT